MSIKQKGTNAERELVHLLWGMQVPAIRVAGSGSSKYPSPDIIAGTPERKLVIECKSIKGKSKYIPKKEVEDLLFFARKFGAEPWIGIRFAKKEWHFISHEDLEESKTSYVITHENIKIKGLLIEELI